jgi:hypothetical protein
LLSEIEAGAATADGITTREALQRASGRNVNMTISGLARAEPRQSRPAGVSSDRGALNKIPKSQQ